MFLNIGFIIVAIPIWGIVFIQYQIKKPKKLNEEVEEVPLEEEQNIDQLRALYEKAEKERQKWIEYRRNVDLRQFKGRNDVTKEEVAEYLWYHKNWEGKKEKIIILDEIMKVCDINEEDVKWIMKEHYNHVAENGSIGAGHYIRNEETRRIMEYERKKAWENDRKIEERLNRCDEVMIRRNPQLKERLEKRNKENERFEYIFNYEGWLKKKGYV